jgi:acetyl-CoA synthase
MGWETRLVPYGRGIEPTVYALGFAARVAMSFGGVQPGDFVRNLRYNKNRVFAFVLALGSVDDEKYANAAGAINFGFPTIADTDIPQILPSGVCTYEHVVSNVPLERIVEKAIEVRGLKITITEIPIPVPYSPAFEGERVRKEQMQVEFGGQRTPAVEFLTTRHSSEEVEDGKIELIGPDIDTVEEGGQLPLAIFVEVYGRKMQSDFEPILERQIHMFCNGAQGLFHMGQRDINWIRISKEAYKAGFRMRHIGDILYAKFHEDFGAIFDKIQVTLYTNEEDVLRLRDEARKVFAERDARLAGMTDESVDTFYSCTLCQSFAPNHVCMITPEHPGLCGAYNWLDGRAAYEINPAGPNQPVPKGKLLDERLGQWDKVNEFVYNQSNFTLERFSAYSMMVDPMTSCGCFECASVVLPSTNGIMIVPREYPEMTPCGMKFSTLAGEIGGGKQTPGFFGHSKQYISSPKFHKADGGLSRVVWMTQGLKEEIRDAVTAQAKALDLGEDFLDKVADETVANTEEEVLAYITEKGHPALQMEPMF